MARVEDLQASLESADCVVIVTDHAAYDWQAVQNASAVLVDTRNVLRERRTTDGPADGLQG